MAHNAPSPALVSRAVALIEARTGLNVGSQFQTELPSLLDRLSGGDLLAYIQRMEKAPEVAPEWQTLINTLTIGETYFLRDADHFRLLRQHILPALTLEKRQKKTLDLNVWCAGCATGEEPYSVAITLQEFLPDIAKWRINIVGTDINQRAIETARRALYRRWSFRHTPDSFERRYFDVSDAGAELQPQIQRMVTFKRMNVLEAPPLPACDIIFCRNILLYLTRTSIERVEDSLFQALHPGGWLLLGQAEALRYERERWLLHVFPGTPIYQKPGQRVPDPAARVRYEPPKQDEDITSIPMPPVQPTREVLYADAVRAIQAEHHDDAERFLAGVLAQQPAHARAHTLLAFIFANRQAIPEAHAHLDTAISNEPLLADAFYIRALVHQEQSEFGKARDALKSALYCDRNHVLALYFQGTLQAKAGDLPDAYRLWRNARRALGTYAPDDYVSEFSNITARVLDAILGRNLEE
jgi:chemotaxis protein methyltransferase CheR